MRPTSHTAVMPTPVQTPLRLLLVTADMVGMSATVCAELYAQSMLCGGAKGL